MGDCPKCGLADPGAVDFCPNPQCRTCLGRASAAAPSHIASRLAAPEAQPAVAVSVANGGNTPVSTQLAFHDQGGALTFEPQEGTATLQPRATEDLLVLVNRPRRWFGRTERYPFSAVLTPASPQPPITLNGTRQQTAVFPWWVPLPAVAVAALAIALAALLSAPMAGCDCGLRSDDPDAAGLSSPGRGRAGRIYRALFVLFFVGAFGRRTGNDVALWGRLRMGGSTAMVEHPHTRSGIPERALAICPVRHQPWTVWFTWSTLPRVASSTPERLGW